jgi:hypothetical protein
VPASVVLKGRQGKIARDEKENAHHEHIEQGQRVIDGFGWVRIVIRPKGHHGSVAYAGVKNENQQDHQHAQVVEKDHSGLV